MIYRLLLISKNVLPISLNIYVSHANMSTSVRQYLSTVQNSVLKNKMAVGSTLCDVTKFVSIVCYIMYYKYVFLTFFNDL